MRIVVDKHWQVYIVLGCTGNLSLVIMNLHIILHMHVEVNTSSLPVYRITSLLCIFETSVFFTFKDKLHMGRCVKGILMCVEIDRGQTLYLIWCIHNL